MARNKHHYHHFDGNRPRIEREHSAFSVPVSVQIEQRPSITIPLDEYETMIRISERTEIAIRYIAGEKYGVDKDMLLEIFGVTKSDEGGDDA